LNQILHNFDLSGHNLAEIEDRLYAIRSLSRKHNCSSAELAQFISKSKETLAELESRLKKSDDLNDKMLKIRAEYFAKAQILSQRRQVAAKNLESKVDLELAMLDMKKAVFSVEIRSCTSPGTPMSSSGLTGGSTAREKHKMDYPVKPGNDSIITSKGIDEVRFLASTNPGMPNGPIDKIASGGELARFMLALRAALFDKCLKPTIIFDEIDVGISGSVADFIGSRLKLLSKIAQVIVITHQPQVAGQADLHILVHKTQGSTKTLVDVTSLDLEGRAAELARMISGRQITEKSLAAAKELIQ
jgi:DNA repair protein RecN (Recombination protein N)